MPTLSREEAHQFWKSYKDPSIHRVISVMENIEDWTLDGHADLEAAIEKLGESLEDLGNVDLKEEGNFIKLGAFIHIGRTLYLLQWLDSAYPGSASKLLTYAEDNNRETGSPEDLFLHRNIIFERLRLLGRVFSPQRLAEMEAIFERDRD